MCRVIVSTIIVIATLSLPASAQVPDLAFGQIQLRASWEPSAIEVQLPGFRDHDVTLNTFAAQIEVGVLPARLSVFGAAGTGDARMDGLGIHGSIDHFWRGGFRATAWRQGPWSLGVTADVSEWRAQDSFLLAERPMGTELTLTEYRVRPTISWTHDPVTFYGGPSIVWLDGSVDVYWDTLRHQAAIKTKAEFGGFAGAMWRIHPHVALFADGKVAEVSHGAVAGVACRF